MVSDVVGTEIVTEVGESMMRNGLGLLEMVVVSFVTKGNTVS